MKLICDDVSQVTSKANTTFTANNCTWINNTAGFFGGGMGMVAFGGSRIIVSIFGSLFSHSKAQRFGGGVYIQDVVSIKMSRTIFRNNRAVTGYGGGTFLWVRT